MNVHPAAASELTVLVIDDDVELCELLSEYLAAEGYAVECLHGGREGVERALIGPPAIVVLDVMLPDIKGFEVLRRIRAVSHIPILMLTARGDEQDRILGLQMGADDYLPKPFNPRELLARINAVLRRQSSGLVAGAGAARLKFQGWTIDLRLRELRDPDGAQVPLTSAEFDLLQAFCERSGRILARDSLLNMTRGRAGSGFGRSIDVLVSRLRRKLDRTEGSSMIKTVRIGGYVFTPLVEEA